MCENGRSCLNWKRCIHIVPGPACIIKKGPLPVEADPLLWSWQCFHCRFLK